jgi:DNA-binding XRE family transcriptional regulator
MTDSDFIRSARQALGYTQKQLAEKVCASTRSVIRWENDGSVPHRVRMLINLMVEEQARKQSKKKMTQRKDAPASKVKRR